MKELERVVCETYLFVFEICSRFIEEQHKVAHTYLNLFMTTKIGPLLEAVLFTCSLLWACD